MQRLGRLTCFFFNDTATTEIYTLSLHDALPILFVGLPITYAQAPVGAGPAASNHPWSRRRRGLAHRSEEHTSELQSRLHLVCRLLLEKKQLAGLSISSAENLYHTGTASGCLEDA